jgi:hypothetical protein
MIEGILDRFESPDERRLLEKGTWEVVRLCGLNIGRAS